jgi:uncharacterized protein DUF6065
MVAVSFPIYRTCHQQQDQSVTITTENDHPRSYPGEQFDSDSGVPRLICYPVVQDPPEIVPARAARDWMDRTDQRFAYRCIPLSIANASGWEILSPVDFTVTWTGGDSKASMSVSAKDDRAKVNSLASSHFGHGVLTFHTGYLFRTSPGWALWVRGSPNTAKRNLAPLDGLVETDWLDFPFTMNWRFTRPATIHFEKGEPFCFVTPVPHATLDRVQPEIRALDEEPALKAAYETRCRDRGNFNAKLAARDPDAVAQGWQRHYVRGEDATGRTAEFHLSKRKLRPVRRV